ncbi:MAG: laminin G domain-containing protein [Fibrobacteres bacterium]|nr:laminin G domain-containing protein [Fibrobacterota bacterium]
MVASGISFGIWIKAPLVTTNVSASTRTVLGSGASNGAGTSYIYLNLRNSNYYIRYQDTNDDYYAISPQIPNQWTHLGGSLNLTDRKLRLYVNGELKNTTSAISNIDPLLQTLLKIGGGLNTPLDGKLAECSVFTGALTDDQFHLLAKTGDAGVTPAHFFPLSDLPSTYLDTIGGATGTGTATTYSPDVPTQLPVAIDTEARSSLSFDGVDDKVTFTPITVPVYTGSATLDIYLKRLGAGDMCLFGYDQTAYKFLTWYASGGIVLETNTNNDAATASAGYALLNPDFHRITCVSTLGVVKMFFDGKRIPMSDSSVSNDVTIDRIGLALTGFPLKALVKSARIWNTALTDQQIRDLHFSNIVPTDGLVLNLKLNEGAGTIAYDSSGNGNDGTITGATWSASVPSKAREVIGGNLVKNGDLAYQPPFVAETTASGVWVDGSAAGSATNNLFSFATYLSGSGSVSFDETENALKLVRTSTSLNNATWVALRKTFSAATPLVSELPLLCKIKPNTAYTFKFKRKQDGNLKTNQAQYKYQTYSASAVRNLNVTTTGNPTTEWEETVVTFTSGASDRYFECAFVNGYTGFTPTAGTIWVKDISLTETTLPTRTTTTTRTTLTCP